MKRCHRSLAVLPLITALISINGISVSEANEYDNAMNRGRTEQEKASIEAAKTTAAYEARDNSSARAHFQEALVHYRQAVAEFYTAERLEPLNAEAFFFRGGTFNRKGDLIKTYNDKTGNKETGAREAFCAALHEINRSIALGRSNDQESSPLVERAFALLRTDDALQAKRIAEQFLSLHIGNSSLRDLAGDIIKEAQPKVDEGKKEAQKIHICGIAPPPKAGFTKSEPATSDGRVQSKFLKSITTGVGYNGNVTLLGRGLPLPATTLHKGAVFNESALSLEGDWFFYHKNGAEELVDKFAATYLVIHDAYDDLSSSNTLTQTTGLNYCRALSTRTCVGLQLKDAWIRSDTKNVSNTLFLQPSVNYAESAELTTQISYGLIRSDYSVTPPTPLAALDGFGHQVAVQQTWAHALREGQWSPQITMTAKYIHQWTLTDGIVGDKQRDDPFVKADWLIFQAADSCSLVRSVSLTASYEYRRDKYENATFPMLNAANRFKRRDDTHLVGVALSIKLWYDEALKNRLEAILEYQSTTNDSNVAAKTYDQPRFNASVKVNF